MQLTRLLHYLSLRRGTSQWCINSALPSDVRRWFRLAGMCVSHYGLCSLGRSLTSCGLAPINIELFWKLKGRSPNQCTVQNEKDRFRRGRAIASHRAAKPYRKSFLRTSLHGGCSEEQRIWIQLGTAISTRRLIGVICCFTKVRKPS